MTGSKTRLGVSAYAISVFVFTLGSSGVRALLGVPAFIVVGLALGGLGIALFARLRPTRFRWYRLPAPLYWFLGLAAVSIAWSAAPAQSAAGIVAQLVTTAIAVVLAFVLSWHELLRTLASALRLLLVSSLLFELVVAIAVRAPIQPWWADAPEPSSAVWSSARLLHGGPIEGIVGSPGLLGFLAVLAVIVFGIQLRAGLVRPFGGWCWLGAAALALALTRSVTAGVALAVALVALAVALWARRIGPVGCAPLYLSCGAALGAISVAAVLARSPLLALLGPAAEATGLQQGWTEAAALAAQRPWFGWGWLGYQPTWPPTATGIDAAAGGLPAPGAPGAWLDVWLQLGIVGLAVFTPLVLFTLVRVWFRAVDQPRRGPGPARPYATSALWPLLVTVALLVQSITESRLLTEGGWLLLVVFAVKSRFDFQLPSQDAERTALPWRRVPIPRRSPRADGPAAGPSRISGTPARSPFSGSPTPSA